MSKEQKRFDNMDADESIFFARELESVKSKSYDVLYPELKARSLFPVSMEAGPGAETIKYEQYDMVGMAKIISSYADDLPRADVKGKEFISSVRSLADSYGYSLQEVRAAKLAGKPLAQKRADAAKKAIMELENRIAFKGDAPTNIQGFLSNTNVTLVTLPNVGAWTGLTGDQMLDNLNALANTPSEVTNGVEIADTLILPIKEYNLIKTKRIGIDTNMTVLKFFMETNEYIKNVQAVIDMKAAGPSGQDILACYKKDPNKIEMQVPQDFEQLEIQPKNLEYLVPCHSRFGGVLIFYPLSVAKAYTPAI